MQRSPHIIMDYRLYQLEFIVGLSYISNGVLKKNLLSSIYGVCNLPSKHLESWNDDEWEK